MQNLNIGLIEMSSVEELLKRIEKTRNTGQTGSIWFEIYVISLQCD